MSYTRNGDSRGCDKERFGCCAYHDTVVETTYVYIDVRPLYGPSEQRTLGCYKATKAEIDQLLAMIQTWRSR